MAQLETIKQLACPAEDAAELNAIKCSYTGCGNAQRRADLCFLLETGYATSGFDQRATANYVARFGRFKFAPLAQSAERFHGKEKVDGSIPSGGSVILYAVT